MFKKISPKHIFIKMQFKVYKPPLEFALISNIQTYFLNVFQSIAVRNLPHVSQNTQQCGTQNFYFHLQKGI